MSLPQSNFGVTIAQKYFDVKEITGALCANSNSLRSELNGLLSLTFKKEVLDNRRFLNYA